MSPYFSQLLRCFSNPVAVGLGQRSEARRVPMVRYAPLHAPYRFSSLGILSFGIHRKSLRRGEFDVADVGVFGRVGADS